MAKSGMSSYVAHRNGVTAGEQHKHDDLKFSNAAKNGHLKPAKAKNYQEGHAIKQERPFYGTEASVDETLTVESVKAPLLQSTVDVMGTGTEFAPESHDGDEGSEHDSERSGEDESGDTDHELGEGLNRHQRQLWKNYKRGLGLQYVKGDSYPPTTSGRQSGTDIDGYEDYSASSHPQQRVSDHGRNDVRHPHHSAAQAPTRVQIQQNQTLTSGNHFARPTVVDQPVEDQFTFGKAAQPKPNLKPAGPGKAQTKTVPSITTAQHGPVSAASAVPAQTLSKPDREESRPLVVTLPQQQHPSQDRDARNDSRTACPSAAEPVTTDAKQEPRRADGQAAADDRSSVAPPSESEFGEHAKQLDYDLPALYSMDFHQLKDQSFDTDPNAALLELPNVQQHDPLEVRLSNVNVLGQRHQFDFFSGLALDEWEQAGDWFLGRFGDVLSKLKTTRQEKRKAAQLLEDEISTRYEAIGKKRKLIESSMGEMRESGGKVLAGTPKKAKQK